MAFSSAVLTAASASGWELSQAPVELATWPRAEDSPEAVQPGWAVAMGVLEAMALTMAMAVSVLIMVLLRRPRASHVRSRQASRPNPLTHFLRRLEIGVLAVAVIVHGCQHGVHLDLLQRQHPSRHRQRVYRAAPTMPTASI